MNTRNHAINAFKTYTQKYDPTDPKIRLKIVHTMRVAELSDTIAHSLGLDKDECELSWLIGLLHDIGRFEQIRRFGTFLDSESIDHAEFGADLLFDNNLITEYITSSFISKFTKMDVLALIEYTIRLHNKMSLPKHMDPIIKQFSQILRDADKIDILRVEYEIPFDDRKPSGGEDISKPKYARAVRDEIRNSVLSHKCAPRMPGRTQFEVLVSNCSLAFDLVYPKSRAIVRRQGYLEKLLQPMDSFSEDECDFLQTLRREMEIEFHNRDNALTDRDPPNHRYP